MAPDPYVSLLLFACVDQDALASIREVGSSLDRRGIDIFDRLETARDRCDDKLIVIDTSLLSDGTERVPPEAMRNLDPYLVPSGVTAAGGYVMRHRRDSPEVLVIHRRGIWDLPKGKLDPGESIEECAVREVREELGIDDVALRRSLGATVHGYPLKDRYMIKTTHWFEMSTTAERFYPEIEEDIDAIEWMSWGAARARLGHTTLRRHMDRLSSRIGVDIS